MIRIQAHRGASRHYPENTIPAYEGAIRENYQIIELDPKFTKDDCPVLLHDYTVNRTGRRKNGEKLPDNTKIGDLTLAEAREIDFGIYFAPEFAGITLPTFAEILDFAKEHRFPIKVDNVLEDYDIPHQEIMFRMVRDAAADEYVGFTCRTIEFAHRVSAFFPNSEMHYDGPVSREILEKLKSGLHNNRLSIWLPAQKKSWLPYPPADEATVAMCREYGEVGLWTATDEENLRHILSLKPDAVEIDGIVTPEMVNGGKNE